MGIYISWEELMALVGAHETLKEERLLVFDERVTREAFTVAMGKVNEVAEYYSGIPARLHPNGIPVDLADVVRVVYVFLNSYPSVASPFFGEDAQDMSDEQKRKFAQRAEDYDLIVELSRKLKS